MSSKLRIGCEAFMEACWLAAAGIIPLFFNISSVRMFELDKVLILRFLVILAVASGLLKWIDRRMSGAAASNDEERMPSVLKHPLAILALALSFIYILSSIFSISPAQSWWGSYLRSQGSMAFLGYVILFFVVLRELRTSAQLQRLQYAIILTSIPISAYTILQFAGLDPMPWRDSLQGRSSGSMGNPIFLGGYLVMVIPITFGRLTDAVKMLRAENGKKPGIVLMAACGMAILIQALALLCTESRGPMMGLLAGFYLCIFLFLVLKRSSGNSRLLFPAAAAGIGFLAPPLLILIIRIALKLPASFGLLCMGIAILLIGALYVALWFAGWSKGWLWLTWLAQTLAIGIILSAGPGRVMGSSANAFPLLGRLARFSDQSADVRQLLWKTSLNTFRSGAPALLPNDTKDIVHSFRPAIGYGPETIWFAVNIFGVPELQTHWAGEADRMHNEVFDNLITLGFSGTILSLFIFGAAFYYSLRYLGLLNGTPRKFLFAIFLIVGSGLGVLAPWIGGSPHLAGPGIQAGLIAGLFAYIALIGFGRREASFAGERLQIYVICILGALIAHFIETSVCIAVTPTRTCFFLLLAILAVLTSRNLKESEPAKPRGKPVLQRSPSLRLQMATASFIVMTLAWCFVVNTTMEPSPWRLVLRTLFVPSYGDGIHFPFTVPLVLLILTLWGSIGLLSMDKRDSQPGVHFFRSAAAMAFKFPGVIWLVFGFLSAFFWSSLDSSLSSPLNESLHAEARVTLFYLGLLLSLAITAWNLVSSDPLRYAAASAVRAPGWGGGFLLAIGASVAILNLTVYPAWADVSAHIAHAYEHSNELQSALPVYERAVKLAPDNISYRMSLGLAQARMHASSGKEAEEPLQSLKHALDLNPLDPAAFRALGNFYAQWGEQSTDPGFRDAQILKAIPYLEQAVRLAPHSAQTYNELGRCYALRGDFAKAGDLYKKSMQLYPENGRTYLFLGDMYFRQKNLERSLQSYRHAASIGGGMEAQRQIGVLLAQMGRRQEAIGADLDALKTQPKDFQLLYHVALLYFSLGDVTSGLAYAHRAYAEAPNSGNISFETFVLMLEKNSKKLSE
jgi:tetratricopeptide (TPR) repeat protein